MKSLNKIRSRLAKQTPDYDEEFLKYFIFVSPPFEVPRSEDYLIGPNYSCTLGRTRRLSELSNSNPPGRVFVGRHEKAPWDAEADIKFFEKIHAVQPNFLK